MIVDVHCVSGLIVIMFMLAYSVTCGGADHGPVTSMAPQDVPTPHEVLTPAELDKVVPHRGGGEWSTDWVTTSLSPRVIRRGEDAKTATYQECTGYTFLINSMKRPRLVRLEDGRLILLATAWLHKAGEENPIILTSDDEGQSWSRPREILMHGTLVYLGGKNLAIFGGGDSGSNRMIFSQDAGKTWSVPETIPPLPDGRPFHHHGSVVVEGQTVSAIFFARGTDGHAAWVFDPMETWGDHSFLRQSYDSGHTWGDPVFFPDDWQTNEGSLTRAKDGALVVALRTRGGPGYPSYNDSWRRLTTARTTDDGKTWTDFQVHFRFGKTHSELLTLPNGDILLAYAARIAELDGRIYRGIEAVLSHDNGKSWDWANRYYLFRWDMHQSMHSPHSALLSDGRIMTVLLYHYHSTFGKPVVPAAIGMVDAIFWRPE